MNLRSELSRILLSIVIIASIVLTLGITTIGLSMALTNSIYPGVGIFFLITVLFLSVNVDLVVNKINQKSNSCDKSRCQGKCRKNIQNTNINND